MINSGDGSSLVIYDKSDGSVAAGPITLDSLGTGDCANGLGDPIVLYDSLAGRWLLSEFSGVNNKLCVYVSQTADPIAGGWYAYEFATPDFPDYPKYAVWPDGYYVTSNESSPKIYALERTQMLSGAPATMQSFSVPGLSGFGFQALTPADLDGSNAPPSGSPAYFARHKDDEVHVSSGGDDPATDIIELWEVAIDWATPANSTLTGPTEIAVADFDSHLCGLTSFVCFPQPLSSTKLDPLREVIMWRLQYRNFGSHQALLGNFVTDATGEDVGGIRWFELRNTGGGWDLHQEGTYSPDDDNRWMGSIAMDGLGNVALAYNVTNDTNVFPGIRFTGRESSDALGLMSQAETDLIAGTDSSSSNRYGDYSAMSVDPEDDCTFWFTGQFNPSATWSTRIGAFMFDSCAAIDPGCSGADVAIDGRTFASDTTCIGTESIDAQASTVNNGVTVIFSSPSINLGPGFNVDQGGVFRARP
jgi:hypothetical protein